VRVTKITTARPTVEAAEPKSPRGIRGRVKLCEELGEEGRIFSSEGDDAETAHIFGFAHIVPSNLKVASRASFFPSPEEGSTALVNSLKDADRKKPGAQGMSKHCREDRINKKKTTTNGERAAGPPREFQIAFRDDRGKVREAQFIGGERKTQIRLGERRNGAAESGSHGTPKGQSPRDAQFLVAALFQLLIYATCKPHQ
jgi:hypothetical protein